MRTSVKLPPFLEPRPRPSDVFFSALRLLGLAMMVILLFTSMSPALSLGLCAAALALFLAWVLCDTTALRRRQRAMRQEVLFSAWLEGVNKAAARHGYQLAAPTTKDSVAWRERWARGLSPEEALKDAWLIAS